MPVIASEDLSRVAISASSIDEMSATAILTVIR